MPQRNSSGKVPHNSSLCVAIDIDAIYGRMEEMTRHDYTCACKTEKRKVEILALGS